MLRSLMKKKEGFTLVELLIVVAIIGILAAIAIPQFAAYRARAYCSSQDSDLANMAISQEASFVNNAAYYPAQAVAGGGNPTDASGAADTTFTASPGMTITIPAPGGAAWTATAAHPNCDMDGDGVVGEAALIAAGGDTRQWNSAAGGLVP